MQDYVATRATDIVLNAAEAVIDVIRTCSSSVRLSPNLEGVLRESSKEKVAL